jgi:outer membrane receptor protein involved in Fe transport
MRQLTVGGRLAWVVCLVCIAALTPTSVARAQEGCDDGFGVSSRTAVAATWPAPLDVRVSVHLHDVPLGAALEHVSAVSGVRIAYSSDVVPLDHNSCVLAASEPLGQLLGRLLAGTGVEARVVAGRVVLTPAPGGASERDEMAHEIGTLQRVLVTGSAVASPRRSIAIGVDVIEGDQLRRESRTTLPAILDAAAPGVWVWERASSSLVAQYGGIRGASSFGSSYPKIYIDGIEVANPLLVTDFDPNVIERVEVIRGPQGAALYGSDAISGVVNIVTRHDGSETSGPALRVSSSVGAVATAYGTSIVPTHEQQLSLRGGSNLRSTGLAVEFGQVGAVTPAAAMTHLLASGDLRIVGSSATVSATGRFVDKRSTPGANPLLAGLPMSATDPASALATSTATTPQSVMQYTLGSSAVFSSDGPWTSTALVGMDGYQLDHVSDQTAPFPLMADSALRAAEGRGDRLTLRATTVGRFGEESTATPVSVTFGAEQAVLRQIGVVSTTQLGTPDRDRHYATVVSGEVQSWNHNTGLFSQLNAAWRRELYLTAGLRLERNDAFSGPDRYPLLPMVGLATVRDFGNVELKLRTAYGTGIRPPQTPARTASVPQQRDWRTAPAGLDPESQSGTETGAELYVAGLLSVQVTRFNQLASGLIQNVAIAVDTLMRAGVAEQRVRYQPQNVGAISNKGWEMQGSVHQGPWALSGAVALVDSRVRNLAVGYQGDLQPGDRMLAVPARTTSITASWTGGTWFASLSGTRAEDWVDYDRLTLARLYGGTSAQDLVGAKLREYWLNYTGQTHLRFAGSLTVAHGVDVTLTGENLLGGQVGEPDNVTIRSGRTITGGLRASF